MCVYCDTLVHFVVTFWKFVVEEYFASTKVGDFGVEWEGVVDATMTIIIIKIAPTPSLLHLSY